MVDTQYEIEDAYLRGYHGGRNDTLVSLDILLQRLKDGEMTAEEVFIAIGTMCQR